MNKQEKIFAALIALAMAGYIAWTSYMAPPPPPPAQPKPPAPAVAAPAAPASAEAPILQAATRSTEETATLKSDELLLTVSSRGGAIKKAVLLDYREKPAKDSDPVAFDFATAPALALTVPGMIAADADYALKRIDDKTVELTAETAGRLRVTRTIRLEKDYRVAVKDAVANLSGADLPVNASTLSAGALALGLEAGDAIAADTFAVADKGPAYWGGKLNDFFGAKSSGWMGCGGAPSATGLALQAARDVPGAQRWLAVKNRFFAQVLIPNEADGSGARLTVYRDPKNPRLAVNRISGEMLFPAAVVPANGTLERGATLYIGPKKLSTLKSLGVEDVMEFGFFSWFCKLLLPTLNFFYGLIPNYGIAIILLTFLVRTLFWPLTHKSTVSMKKMQTVQPLIKEIQAKYKDNPKKLQQETWAVYREHKVNPLSSCLPMLLQIPVFIALFTVLRSAVELRYAPFLWISDLSQPENLLVGIVPLGLNIWPILMAVTMGIQSWLQPGAGDPAQKKMMTWMMPIMMLVMFYSMPSALCLYWTISQVLSIAQMLWIQRSAKQA